MHMQRLLMRYDREVKNPLLLKYKLNSQAIDIYPTPKRGAQIPTNDTTIPYQPHINETTIYRQLRLLPLAKQQL
jgi:hypothetical protein